MRKERKQKTKRILGASLLFFSVFAVAAAGSFFLIPQKTIERQVGEDDPVVELTGRQILMANLLDSVETGIGATVSKGVVTIEGKTAGNDNVLTLDGTSLKLRMDALSIHDIDLVVDAKVDFNGKNRGLDVALVNDELYFNVINYDAPLDSDAHSWDLKYKVSTASYDSDPLRIDPETGGIIRYEYGNLDWIIEDILAILTDNNVNVTLPSLASLINGGGSGSGEQSSEGSGMDMAAIMDSMNEMEETTIEGAPYFTWNLEINHEIYPIGFKANNATDYQVSRIDFPAVSEVAGVVTQDIFELNDQITLAVQLDVVTNDLEFAVPYDAANYRPLENSLALFEKIATVAGTLQFGAALDLDLYYDVDGEEASVYRFAKDEIHDRAKLTLNANADLKELKLNAMDADLTFAQVGGTNGSQEISAKYIPNGDDHDMYINVNDVLRARTSYVVLDELIGNIKDNLTSSSSGTEATSEATTSVQLFKAESAIGQAIQAVKDSALVSGIDNGVYDSALDLIDYIDSNDNYIRIAITLEPVGIEGNVIVTLGKDVVAGQGQGNLIDPLVTIEFDAIKFASFTVDGTLEVVDYTAPSITETEAATYQEMKHLIGLGDQVIDIVNDKATTINIGGSFYKEGSTSKDGVNPVGVVLEGKAALNFEDKMAVGLQLTAKEYEEKFLQDHHVKFDLFSVEEEVNNELTDVNYALFSYDSINEIEEGNPYDRTNPKTSDPLKGRMSTANLGELVENIMDWATGVDNRFARISRALAKPADASLLSQLTSGKYFALADLHVIKSATFGDSDVIVINAEKLGLDQDITISLDFDANNALETLGVSAAFGEAGSANVLDLSIGLEAGAASSDITTLEDHTLANYDDYGSLFTLVDYLVNTTTVGAVYEDGHGQSTFDINAAVNLKFGDYDMSVLGSQNSWVNLNALVSVDGAQLQIAADLDGVPVIKGLNGPEDSKYFRDHEYEGVRDASFYYYADGLEVNDEVMMTRDSSYGRLRNVKDSVLLSADDFGSDMGGWLLQYFLGVNSEILADDDPSADPSTDPAPASTSAGLPLAHAMHIMDVFHGIDFVDNNGALSWTIDLDLAKLGFGFLGDASIVIRGGTYEDLDGNNFKALSGFGLEANIALAGKLQVLKLSVNAGLANVHDGFYANVWEDANLTGFRTYFKPTAGDRAAYASVASRNHVGTELNPLTAGNLY